MSTVKEMGEERVHFTPKSLATSFGDFLRWRTEKIEEEGGKKKEMRKGTTGDKGEISDFRGLGETFFVSARTPKHKEKGTV